MLTALPPPPPIPRVLLGKHHKKHISHLRRHKQHNVAALKTKTHAKIQAKAPVKTSAKVSLKQAPVSKRG